MDEVEISTAESEADWVYQCQQIYDANRAVDGTKPHAKRSKSVVSSKKRSSGASSDLPAKRSKTEKSPDVSETNGSMETETAPAVVPEDSDDDATPVDP